MDLSTKVLNNYPNFKGASKKIAGYLLAHPKVFLQEDAQGLGKITKTSAASMIRFCKQLGFKGLKDFQIQLAQDTPQENDNVIDPIVGNHDNPHIILQKLLLSIEKNTEQTAHLIDGMALNQAINFLKNADRIYLAGVGASSLPAQDLYYKFIRSGKNVIFNQDVHIALERICYSHSTDVLVIFSYSGLTQETLLMADQARKNHTPIIAVTRSRQSPLVEISNVVLGVSTDEKLLRVGAINSLFSEMLVSSVLFLATINQDLSNLEEKFRKTESLTNQLKRLK
ncbi:MurR/RpiR family transcriptional regulator [Lactobacillus taiwanensis]|uniref:MurR/RpiR family transcriptional regulator n=1 Tax=Lactobacillus taiwanensis TaxID=508451 RepID=UPI00214C1739|nr:MurR/RpiR family transcriptional regulator [Lactobacillus taiwanensis]MCR1916953.1 MurR/RpiR family transcriptional regulator [Lactobacillus taiwanensis]